MGINQSIQKINFEDMKSVIKNPNIYLLINTLPENEQDCLITNTLLAGLEESTINKYLQNRLKKIKIVIYGRNCNDDKINDKCNQLLKLGFYNIYIYTGGLFEWLLLQDIYGVQEFPTTKTELDLLKYKPMEILNIALLEY